MAEFMTKEQMDNDYASKSTGKAGLTLGIIGTALAALGGGVWNNDGCNNNGGILGGLFSNRGNCNCGMTAMAQGQLAQNLAWSNRVASIEDTANLASNLEPRLTQLNNTDWINRIAGMKDLADYAQINETRFTQLNNQDWQNRVDSMRDDAAINNKLSDEVQVLTNQSWMRREQDLNEKYDMYTRLSDANNATNRRICENALADKDDKFQIYKGYNDSDNALNNKFTALNYEGRIQDLNEKFDLYTRLNDKITNLEKQQAKTETALPLMFELNKVNSERYTDNCCCQSKTNLLVATNDLQRQLDHKIDGQLRYAYSDLCAPVPSISPLYCAPFTRNGVTTTSGCTACQA